LTNTGPPTSVDPRIGRAVDLILRLPLRWSEHDRGLAEGAVLDRGWFLGDAECARVLASLASLEIRHGGGFGRHWPLLMGTREIMAPALPAAVGADPVVGADAEYRRGRRGIWREAGGVEDLYLVLDASRPSLEEPFDLLWYGDSARLVVRAGDLEIEDLFGVLRVPASAAILDRILVRSRRLDRAILSSLPVATHDRPQTIEVRRSAALGTEEGWQDVLRFLAARTDIQSARRLGDGVAVRTVTGAEVIFALEEGKDSWVLTRRDGSWVFTEIRLERQASTLGLSATLDERCDAMTPGMRGRLIFDLRSDLVVLGRQTRPQKR
jgi:hypothetical protein